ncbi:hypothetical protein K3495_g6640 [Podosphaera aphanis]|nr:hypothetical protein K3495_g6640 [Podosphaera aphanis]
MVDLHVLPDDSILDEERRHASEYPEEILEDEDIPTPFRDVIENREELQRRKRSDLPDIAKDLGIWTNAHKITRDGCQAPGKILETSENSTIHIVPNTLKTLQERCWDELPLSPLLSSTASIFTFNQPTGKQSGSSVEVIYIDPRLTVAMVLFESRVNREYFGFDHLVDDISEP